MAPVGIAVAHLPGLEQRHDRDWRWDAMAWWSRLISRGTKGKTGEGAEGLAGEDYANLVEAIFFPLTLPKSYSYFWGEN